MTHAVDDSNLHGSLGQGLRQVGTDPLLNDKEKMPRASPGGWGQHTCLHLPALLCEGVRTLPSSAGDCWEMQGAGGAGRMISASGGKMGQRVLNAADHLTEGRLAYQKVRTAHERTTGRSKSQDHGISSAVSATVTVHTTEQSYIRPNMAMGAVQCLPIHVH